MGGSVSLVAELSFAAFANGVGLSFLQRPAAGFSLAAVGAIVMLLSGRRANRRHLKEESALRESGTAKYPGVFDTPPPEDIDATGDDRFDLFDTGACTYLGPVAKSDLRELITRLKGMPDQGPNDIFVMNESLEMLHNAAISPEFVALLKDALRQRGFLFLRWLPRGCRNTAEK